MFFKKVLYPLPRFPADAAPTFRALCRVLTQEEVLQLSQKTLEIEQDFLDSTDSHRRQQLSIVRGMVKACNEMLKVYFNFSKKEQQLVAGAVRYFVEDIDPLSESILVTGFSDDVQVINHVLEKIGFEGLFVDNNLD